MTNLRTRVRDRLHENSTIKKTILEIVRVPSDQPLSNYLARHLPVGPIQPDALQASRPGMGGAVSGTEEPKKNTCDGRAGYH